MTLSIFRTLGVALALATAATTTFAQSGPMPPPPNSVRATGEATVTATPDQAEMSIGVVTEAPTADQASAENARRLEQVLAAVRGALEPGAEVKTVGYSVTPKYVYPRDGSGEPRITGYTASNTVRVTTSDLKRVGSVIDAATKAGANNVSNLVFTLKDDGAVRAEALRQAARQARQQAGAIAEALGARVTRVLFAEESGPTVRPFVADAMAMRAEAASAPTPIEPGTVEIRAVVSVTVGIEQ